MLSIFRISWWFFFQFPAFHSSWPRATSKNTPLMLQYWINSLLRCATHQKLARFFHHTSDPKPSLVLSASSHPAINVLSVFFFYQAVSSCISFSVLYLLIFYFLFHYLFNSPTYVAFDLSYLVHTHSSIKS